MTSEDLVFYDLGKLEMALVQRERLRSDLELAIKALKEIASFPYEGRNAAMEMRAKANSVLSVVSRD